MPHSLADFVDRVGARVQQLIEREPAFWLTPEATAIAAWTQRTGSDLISAVLVMDERPARRHHGRPRRLCGCALDGRMTKDGNGSRPAQYSVVARPGDHAIHGGVNMPEAGSSMRNRAYVAWGVLLAASVVVFIVVSLWTNPLDGVFVLVVLVLCGAWAVSAFLRARSHSHEENHHGNL